MNDSSSEIIEPEAGHVNIPELEPLWRARSLASYRRDVASWWLYITVCRVMNVAQMTEYVGMVPASLR